MKRKSKLYSNICNFNNIYYMTNKVCTSVRNKNKVDKFESFKMEHIYHIYKKLHDKDFRVGKYNIFMINDPKCRIVMSSNIEDKIINHLVSTYSLKYVFENKYDSSMCATRIGKGSLYGIKLLKKYLNEMKRKYNNFYVLKLDISKYFYRIDHKVLKSIIKKKIKDKDVLLLLDNIIDSTNNSYINKRIIELKSNRIEYLNKSNLNNKDKLIEEVKSIPLYEYGKGVALGNESSQAFGLIYLYEVIHFIKEGLHLNKVVSYMDDLIIIYHDKNYLKECLNIIINKLKNNYKLDINTKKTRIDDINNGIDFLGYRFFICNNKVIMKVRNRTKKKYKRKLKDISLLYRSELINNHEFNIHLNSYNGILKWGNCSRLFYLKEVIYIIEKYYKYKVNYKNYIIFIKSGSFYECFDDDAFIINKLFNYKISIMSNMIKVGFPIKKINDLTNILKDNSINYIITDNDIIDKYECTDNRYNEYSFDKEIVFYNYLRINKIIKYLEDNVINGSINGILNRMEEMIES